MTLTKTYTHVIALVVATLVLSMVIGIKSASANPLYFADTSSTATATNTPTFMSAGTATTTLYYDAYGDFSNAADTAALLLMLTGSSTNTLLNVQLEYAPNNGTYNCKLTPTACDWYSHSVFDTPMSTTSPTIALNSITYTVPFASTTQGGAGGISARTTRVLRIPTITRFVRAVLTLPVGSTNGAVWASIQPIKQQPE